MSHYEWDHRRALVRLHTDERIEPGDVFEPTEREQNAFGDRLVRVETPEDEGENGDSETQTEDSVSEAPDDIDLEALSEEHWATVTNKIESGELDGSLDELADVDERDSVQNAIRDRKEAL